MAVALPHLNLPCRHCHETPDIQKENGCIEDSPIPDRWQIGKYKFQRCPGSIITKQSCAYIKAYNWMLRNQLPGGKPWDEQSAKFLQAVEVIAGEINRIEKEEAEKIKRRVN